MRIFSRKDFNTKSSKNLKKIFRRKSTKFFWIMRSHSSEDLLVPEVKSWRCEALSQNFLLTIIRRMKIIRRSSWDLILRKIFIKFLSKILERKQIMKNTKEDLYKIRTLKEILWRSCEEWELMNSSYNLHSS